MRFRNVFSRDALCPEGRYIIIEHQTPELLWQPELMRHANGAVAIEEAMVVANEPGVAERLAALGVGALRACTSAEFKRRFGWSPQPPAFAGVTVAFSNPDAAVRLMENAGVRPRRTDGELWVAPEDANGLVLRMVPC